MDVIEAMERRRSVRSFLDMPVSNEVVVDLVRAARMAPSGANLQPGVFLRVHGEVRDRLTLQLLKAFQNGQQEEEEYGYFPAPMPMSLKRRQVASAKALYDSIGIDRRDRAARNDQYARNLRFFDAPVALLVTIDRCFGSGGFMDLGMAVYGLMLAAKAQGLGSCAIGALASYPKTIRRCLGLSDDVVVVCGLALGRPDPCSPVNRCTTERGEASDFFRVHQ